MGLEEEELVGLWSPGAGYYDTFSDEWLIFKPDGTGRLVFLTPYDDYSYYFRWRIVSRGVIDLIGSAPGGHAADEDSRGEGRSRFDFLGVRYSVSESERPPGTGNWMLELRLGLEMPWPSQLGFVTKDYAGAEARLKNG